MKEVGKIRYYCKHCNSINEVLLNNSEVFIHTCSRCGHSHLIQFKIVEYDRGNCES